MSIQNIISILTNSGIEPNEANKEVKMLIEHFCNYSAIDIILGKPLDKNKLQIVEQKAILRAKTHQPIQYIIGEAYFMNNIYKVNNNVLIPRDETEIIVRSALNIINQHNLKSVLDIGTGSGCIACTIAQNTECNVTAIDISSNALSIAKENAEKLNLKNISFLKSDLFSNLSTKFDIIISNPPYIPKNLPLQKEVTFEPPTALYTNESTGTEFYKKIIEQSINFLKPNGFIVFELGINQSQTVSDFFYKNNFKNITIIKDLAKIDRCIFANI